MTFVPDRSLMLKAAIRDGRMIAAARRRDREARRAAKDAAEGVEA